MKIGVSDEASRDQMALVMLLHGTPAQQEEVARYISRQPKEIPMPETLEHRYPDGLPFGPPEYVKVEMTTKGAKWEIKALTTKRFAELYDELKKVCAEKGIKFEQA